MYKKSFGGNKRSIHTRKDNDLLGSIGTVLRTRKVITGERHVPLSNPMEDFEDRQPYLENAEHHTLLFLKIESFKFWIEAKNVEFFTENRENFS